MGTQVRTLGPSRGPGNSYISPLYEAGFSREAEPTGKRAENQSSQWYKVLAGSQQACNSGTVGVSARDQRLEKNQCPSTVSPAEEFPLTLPFCSIQVFSGLDEAHHCLTQATDLNVNLIHKYPHRHAQKKLCQKAELPVPQSF